MKTRTLRGLVEILAVIAAASGCSSEDSAPDNANAGVGGAAAGQTGVGGSGASGGSAGKSASGGASSGGSGGAAAGASGASGAGGAPRGGASGSGSGGAGTGGRADTSGGSTNTGGGGAEAGSTAAGGTDGAGTGNLGGAGGSSGGTGGAAGGQAGSGGKAGAGGQSGAGGDITIWIAGDSTVANGSNCPIGWGAEFADYFDDRVTVTNSAVGGRSVRTWLYNVGTTMDSSGECVLATDSSGMPTVQARWQAMLDGMKAGDYLFIQFGINDGSATCDRHVGLEAFKTSYGVMAAAAKAHGTQPVFLTPVSAISCSGSSARGTRGGYVTATQEAGEQFDVPVIDLHQLSVDLYNELGFCPIPGGGDISATTGGDVGAFFCDDHTHFDRPGAERIAGLVAEALATQSLGLASYLK